MHFGEGSLYSGPRFYLALRGNYVAVSRRQSNPLSRHPSQTFAALGHEGPCGVDGNLVAKRTEKHPDAKTKRTGEAPSAPFGRLVPDQPAAGLETAEQVGTAPLKP